MAFFKKQQQPINGLWYPQSVTVGKPVTTDQIAAKLGRREGKSKKMASTTGFHKTL